MVHAAVREVVLKGEYLRRLIIIGDVLEEKEVVELVSSIHLPRRAVRSSRGRAPLASRSHTTVSRILTGNR